MNYLKKKIPQIMYQKTGCREEEERKMSIKSERERSKGKREKEIDYSPDA